MNKKLTILFLTFILLMIAVFISVLFGGSSISAAEVLRGLLHPGGGDTASSIIWNIRLPRILLGAVVGMGLAASGSVFQGMLKNPLADPYTLGISGGAAFGATLGILSGITAAGVLFLQLSAFAGTLVCVVIVYGIAARRDFSLSYLILGGVILGFIFSSLVLLMFAVANPQKVYATILWLMGDLSSTNTALTKNVAVIIIAGVGMLSLFGRELNILTLGDEKARHLGIETSTLRKSIFITASLVTGACVSASGIIGFVGLIVPHAMRKIIGADHQWLIPASALGGALFLTVSDAVARTVIAPVELPVGVITGLVGGIFFLIFLLQSKDRIF